LLLFVPLAAAGHDRTTSYSTWEITGTRARVVVRLWEIDITRFPWAAVPGRDRDQRLALHLPQQIRLSAGGVACRVETAPQVVHPGAGRVAFEWQLACPAARDLQIRSDLLLDVAPSHLHFARVRRDGGETMERVLSNRGREWNLDGSSTSEDTGSTGVPGYLLLGIEHILSGYDHLAFVLALLLIGGTFREVAQVVTGFTVAHSVTLGLTALGYVRPANAPIEALIGLSIALVAAENVWLLERRSWHLPGLLTLILVLLAAAAWFGVGNVPAITLLGVALFVACYFGLLQRDTRHGSLRWAVAFLFGLVHGFGFATVLGETGLPAERVARALLGFNAGVEAGQLAVVALVWPTLRWLTLGNENRYRRFVVLGSSVIAALGTFWFVSRTFG
jgi:hypothetical protein